MIVQIDNSKHMVSAYVIFFKKNLKNIIKDNNVVHKVSACIIFFKKNLKTIIKNKNVVKKYKSKTSLSAFTYAK